MVDPQTSFSRDLAGTLLASLLGVVSSVVTTYILVKHLGADGFGAYSTARRVLTAIEPASTFVIGVSLTRFVAMATDATTQTAFLRAGLLLLSGPLVAVAVIGVLVSVDTGLFGPDSRSVRLSQATAILVIANSFYLALYAWYRGVGNYRYANTWQTMVVGLGPIIVAIGIAPFQAPSAVVLGMAGLMLCSVLPLVNLVRDRQRPWSWPDVRVALGSLFSFSLPRIPGNLAFGLMLAVGPILATYTGDVEMAGYIVVGQTMLRLIEAGTDAFGRATFPRFVRRYVELGRGHLRAPVERISLFVLEFGAFSCVQMIGATKLLLWAWLGHEYTTATTAVQITLCALVPYLLYVMLRSVLDVIHTSAVATFLLLIALGVTTAVSATCWLAGAGSLSWAVGPTVGFAGLGALVLARIRADFAFVLPFWRLMRSMAVAMALGGLWIPLSGDALPADTPRLVLFSIVGATAGFACLAYGWYLHSVKAEWYQDAVRHLRWPW